MKASSKESFAAVVISLPSAILAGLVLGQYWVWFIQPVFNIAVPNLVYLIGLHQLTAFFKSEPDLTTSDKLWRGVIMAYTQPVTLLAIGFVIALFIPR